MKSLFGRKASQYLFFEMWPGLILGLVVFVFILLMFQALRLTEFFLVHGIGARAIGEIVFYLAISFLPALFPMALLFSVVLTYGRLSQDSEIVALKAIGYSQWSLLMPALALSLIIALVSGQTSFHLAPWGNRQFEILINNLGQTKAAATLKEGTFSEGFFDLVIYANQVNTKKGELSKIFIYDERAAGSPLTIIAKTGKIIPDPERPGQSILLHLSDGDIHRKGEAHTKIKFQDFDIRLIDPVQIEQREKTPPSLTIEEIRDRLQDTSKLKPEDVRTLRTEFHKRWAIALACVIFGAFGVGLGTQTNRRTKSNGLILSLGVIIGYWILYVTLEGFARTGQMPVPIAIWTPNFIFLGLTVWRLRKVWA
jgi:lipopolysaccharide export system permease protein